VELADLGRFVLGVIEDISEPEENQPMMEGHLDWASRHQGEAINSRDGRGFTYIGEGGDGNCS